MGEFVNEFNKLSSERQQYTLQELVPHLIGARQWERLDELLTTFGFLESKCSAGMAFALLEDYDEALKVEELKTKSSLAQMQRALSLALPSLSDRPDLAVQSIYNRLVWFDKIDPQLRDKLETTCSELDERSAWIRAEAPLPGTEIGATSSIPFRIESRIQSVSADGRAIAIVSMSGDVEVRELPSGKPRDNSAGRSLDASRIIAIALNKDSVVYADAYGMIRSEQYSDTYLERRRNEKVLACHPVHGVLAARRDGTLVVWQPRNNNCIVLDTDLPFPLVILHITPDGRHVLYVAGHNNQRIGIAHWSEEGWTTKAFSYNGPPIIDADLGVTGETLLLACKDRSLRTIDLQSNELMTIINYEKQKDVILRGLPIRCALGSGISTGWAFVATRDGQVGAWNWQQSELRRLEDYRSYTENNVSICCFQALFATGQLLLSTESYGKMLDQESVRKTLTTNKHTAPVTGCLITDSQKIVSVSQKDNTICWLSSDGLATLTQRYQKGVTAVAKIANSDDVLLGDYQGWIWRQPPDREVTIQSMSPTMVAMGNKQVFHLFLRKVVSLFTVDGNTIIAADSTGQAFQVKLHQDEVKLLRQGSGGLITQQAIFPAGENGLYWSLHVQVKEGDVYSIFSLIRDAEREDVVSDDRYKIVSAAVTQDGNTFCLAGETVKVFRREAQDSVYTRWTLAEHVAFLGKGDWLAAVLESSWLEIWQVAQDLPTVAAIRLPGNASCLSTNGDRLVVGFDSGELMSLRLRGRKVQSLEF